MAYDSNKLLTCLQIKISIYACASDNESDCDSDISKFWLTSNPPYIAILQSM